jgi:hypothetical protein
MYIALQVAVALSKQGTANHNCPSPSSTGYVAAGTTIAHIFYGRGDFFYMGFERLLMLHLLLSWNLPVGQPP